MKTDLKDGKELIEIYERLSPIRKILASTYFSALRKLEDEKKEDKTDKEREAKKR